MTPPNLTISAASERDLLIQLGEIDITVPLMTKGRRKEHREQYMMARFLSTRASEFCFPIEVVHSDVPDFVLKTASAVVGIECVEAVPQELYEIEILREKEYPDSMNFGQKFVPGKRTFSRQERRQIASGELAGPPWMPQGAKRNWVSAMQHFVEGKTAKLRKGNYAAIDTMWLLVQDEWPNSIQYYPDQQVAAANELAMSLAALEESGAAFEHVFICTGSLLLTVSQREVRAQQIRDLWR